MNIFIRSIEFTYTYAQNMGGNSTLVAESSIAEIKYTIIFLKTNIHVKAEIQIPVTDGMSIGDIKYRIANIYRENT